MARLMARFWRDSFKVWYNRKRMYRPRFTITHTILAKVARIEELRGQTKGYNILPDREAFIRKRATVEASHSSTSIEGNPLSLKQVEKTLSSENRLTKEQYAEIEVRNYKKTLGWISKRAHQEDIQLRIDDILSIHGIVTDSLLEKSKSGSLRKNPVYIVDQNGDTVYTAPEPEYVKEELDAFLSWVNSPDNKIHPVIIAGIIHYMLASIHPFADGNGRTARAAVSLYLSLASYDFRESLVLDSYYAVDRAAYYDSLKSVQNGNYSNAKAADITLWLEYFTEGFLSSAEILSVELKALSIVGKNVIPRRLTKEESDIVSYVAEFGSIDLSEAEGIMPNSSRRTIQRKFGDLVNEGYLRVEGKGPSTKYVAPNKEFA